MFSSKGAFKKAFAFAQDESVQDVAAEPDGSVWGTALQAGEARSFGGSSETLATPSGQQAIGVAVDASGNVYVSGSGNNAHSLTRFDKAAGYAPGKTFGGFSAPGDVEASPDGSVYVVDGLNVKRFVDDKVAKTIKGGVSKPIGIGVDLDCNLWMTNISQRNLTRVSPTGKILGTATSGDLIAQDVAIGPTGDLYAYDSGTKSVVRFSEDRSKPQQALVAGSVDVSGGKAKVKYTLTGVACPTQVVATASLKRRGQGQGEGERRPPASRPCSRSPRRARAGRRSSRSCSRRTAGRRRRRPQSPSPSSSGCGIGREPATPAPYRSLRRCGGSPERRPQL